jgi:hypothetical protein
MDAGNVYVKYTALFDTKAAPVTTEPTATGMKETITLADEKSPHELRWLVETNGNLVPDVGNMVRVRASDGTYPMEIAPPKAWDKAGKPVMAVASVEGDTLTFKVTVLPGQEYPVTVDPSTVVGDTDTATGMIYRQTEADYLAGRNSPSGAAVYDGQTCFGVIHSNIYYTTYRGALVFDTSVLPDASVLDSAKVKMTVQYKGTNCVNADSVYLIKPTFVGAVLDTSWYNDFTGWVSSGAYTITNYAPAISPGTFADEDTISYKLNADGLAALSLTGTTKFFVITEKDRASTTPANNTSHNTYVYDDATYIQIWYVAPYEPVPTGFILHTPTTTGMKASWTIHHSASIDSETIYTGAGVWYAKMAGKQDTSYTFTGLNQNVQYIYKVRIDSTGTSGNYSNADTLYTLAAAPSSFALAGTDSTIFTPSFSENSNPAATTYAIRDSTLQKWVGGDGIADSASAGWLTHAQWVALSINLVTNNANHTVGIVAKNGDGVQTAYAWITATTGNYYVRTIAPHRWYNYGGISGSEAEARAQSFSDSIMANTVSHELGQSLVGALYSVFRAGGEWVLPRMTEVLTDSLIMTGIGDLSDTDFNIRAAKGTWSAGTPTKEWYYTWSGWTAGAGAYTITDLIKASFSTADYATTMRIAMSDSGAALITRTSADTLRMVMLSSRDVAATAPSGDEYIGASTASLKLFYTLFDAVPSNVVVTSIAGATDSILVTWTDNSLTETGYALVNAYTGTRLGGDDSTAADTSVKRMGGRTPNTKYNIAIKVLGGKIAGDVSTAQDSCYTRAAVLIKPIVRMDTDSTRKVIIDTTGSGNPGYTRYAISDSITGKFVDWISGSLDTLHGTWTSSTAEYRTFANWNISGDTTTVKYSVGKTSAFRIYSKSSQ